MKKKKVLFLIVLCIIAFAIIFGVFSRFFNGNDNNLINGESVSQTESETDDMNTEWKRLYMAFIEKEREQPEFTLTDFSYAFADYHVFEAPLLIIKDEWNLYLFYLQEGKVCSAKNDTGDSLELLRMDYAYTKNGDLFVKGSCDAPKAEYFGKVEFEKDFYVKYLAESIVTKDGRVIYHDDQGNEFSKERYEEIMSEILNKAENVVFNN